MINTQSIDVRTLSLGDQEVRVHPEKRAGAWSYRMKLGRETIWLDPIEYRIMAFLAEKPYYAYTPERITAAVNTARHPVTVETLDNHISSLRDKLGFFRDYIQSVPYIGYRFKA